MQCFSISSKEIKNRFDPYFYLPNFYNIVKQLRKSPFKIYNLSELCIQITDGTHYTPTYTDSGVRFISVKDIKENSIDFNNTKFISQKEHNLFIKRCKPEKGDILLTKIGTIGNACIVPDDAPNFSLFVSVALLKLKQELISPLYMQAVLSTFFAKQQMKRELKGIGVPDLHLESISNLKIPVPDKISEQNKIAQILQKAYNNKKKKEQEAESILLDIDNIILKELDIRYAPVDDKKAFSINYTNIKDKRFDVYGYQLTPRAIINAIKQSAYKETIVPLKSLIIENFAGDWGEDIEKDINENYSICNVIRNKNFNNIYNIDYDDVAQRKISNSKKEKILLKKGDILIEKSGGSPQQPVGRVVYINNDLDNYTFSNFLQCIRINTERCLPEYLFIYLRTIYKLKYMKYIQSQTTGIINLLMDDFLNIPVILLEDRNAQQEIINKYNILQGQAKHLQEEARREFQETKIKVEKIILGEE